MNLPDNAIEIKNLSKIYSGSGKEPDKKALDNVSLSIPRGSLFALLGPNGAGKSTMINIIAGLVKKTSGTVNIWNTNIDDDMRQAQASIGIVPQEINFDPFFSPRKILDIHAGMFGIPEGERLTDQLLELVGLTDKAGARTRSLSGGMRRRLMVAKALVHQPPILILDEPTAGVDIELRQKLWENVRALNKQGVTVVLTTHYLEEAEELCDQIAVINNGQIIANEDKATFLNRVEGKCITLKLANDITDIPESLQKFGGQITGKNGLTFSYNPSEQDVCEIIDAVKSAGGSIIDIATEESDLEDVFLQLTSHAS